MRRVIRISGGKFCLAALVVGYAFLAGLKKFFAANASILGVLGQAMGEKSRAVLDAADKWLAALDAQEQYGATPSLTE
jgi:hypothetical protein